MGVCDVDVDGLSWVGVGLNSNLSNRMIYRMTTQQEIITGRKTKEAICMGEGGARWRIIILFLASNNN